MAPPTLMGKVAVAPHPGEPAPSTSGAHMDLECPICYQEYNPYNKCPRMLECLHAFCTECLQRIQLCSYVPREPNRPPALPCPLCRHLTPLETGDPLSLPCNSLILARLKPMDFMLPVKVASHLSTVAQRVVLSFEADNRDAYIILPTVSLRVQQMHPGRPYGTAPGLVGEEEVMEQDRRTMYWVQVLAVLFWVMFVIICVIAVVFGPHVLNRKL